MAADHGSPIFDNCVFSFVTSKELPELQALELGKTLEDHDGKVLPTKRDKSINIEEVTHIISTTSDFPQYAAARRNMIIIVTPDWIRDSLLKNKTALPRPYTPDPRLIFSKVTISCGDIPTGDKDAIVGAVLAMGGMESSALTKATTHICALTLEHSKCQAALQKRLSCKIVLPHWFDDCLKLGKRIDEGPYLLPDPEILRLNPEDPLPLPPSDNIHGASSARPDSLPLSTDSPRRLDVFTEKSIMISEDLQIGSRLRKVLEDLIVGGGGSITTSIHNADMYICHWREGRDFTFASRAGIEVGNLSWLYHLVTHNAWTSPLRRLLHYPVPREGIPGFSGLKITLSNYGGEARTYLENLIQATGAEFTKSMKDDNTHLITARNSSEKCEAAGQWNIEMINHLWLEESYAKCEIQKLSDPRYTTFPPRTNLGEIIGQTPFDPKILRAIYFPRDPTPSPNDPQPMRRPVMHEKDRNMSSAKKYDRHSSPADEVDDEEPPTTQKKPMAKPRARVSSGNISTPLANRRISAGKENNTPSSTGSRHAKDKALSNLHGMAPDIALYEKEKKRKGPVWGGERAANKIEKERTLERSSSPAKAEEEEGDFSSDEETRGPKRQRTGLPAIDIRLLVTSYPGWLSNMAKEDSDKKKLRELGILVVQESISCTHLAAPAMVRTKKFLCALASGPTIVKSDFIDACVQKGKIPNMTEYALKDTANEKKFRLKLKDVVVRAKANKRRLLRRVPIYCTESIPNGPDTYKEIVLANGGTFSIFRGKPILKKVNPEEDEGEQDAVYLITGVRPDEKKLWPKFVEEAKKGNMIPRIVTTDWLLDVAMAQQRKWDDRYLVEGQ